MATLLSKGDSLWLETVSPQYAQLETDTRVDVAVIGGVTAGLTAAYLLKQQSCDEW